MKMHLPSKLLLFILQLATLLSIHFPCFPSREVRRTITARPCTSNNSCVRSPGNPFINPFPLLIIYPVLECSTVSFNCGPISYISYPFWGGSGRGYLCGEQGFKLVCNGNVPMLNISSSSYRVLEINLDKNTLRVAREDLWDNICPKVLHNTTIDPNLLRYSPVNNDQNVTLYFECNSTNEGIPFNRFSCNGDDSRTMNIFNVGDPSSGPGPGITCKRNIFVPINSDSAESLENLTASSINTLHSALQTGFSLTWTKNEKQYLAPFCNAKVYGSCISQDSDTGKSSPSPGTISGVILGIAGGVVVISFIIYCCHKRRHLRRSSNQKKNQEVENILLQHGSLAPKRYKHSEIKKITKSFNEKLGQGGYGSVYKGNLPDGCLVAVKVLVEIDGDGEEFINEVASISRTSHVNVVNLLGFCYDRNKKALVYEFMPNKSLDKFMSSNVDCQLDVDKLYTIALGVAKGLEYLHTGCNTRIVHFDIKPQNILLDADFCPKISDFGLAKLCQKKKSILSVLGTRGTVGYIAPEVFSRNFGGVSYKSDVYSYGMMVLEMVGARNIFETVVIESSENYFPDKIYEEVILDVTKKLDDLRIEEEDDRTRKMFLVGFWCIQTIPKDRPSMSKVVEMLEGSLQSIQIPPKPFLFSPMLSGQEFSPTLSACTETEMMNP